MHDLDRTYMETEGDFEYVGESEMENFEDASTSELAAELLGVTSDKELDLFLGNLFTKVKDTVGKVISSPVGKQLGGMLRKAAKTYLPKAGAAVGNYIAPGVGGDIGSQIASGLGQIFGLELEGLSSEDREFEVAKQFVRFATSAASNAAGKTSANPVQTARDAFAQAAQKYAPGLLVSPASALSRPALSPPSIAPQSASPTQGGQGAQRTGRWVRRGGQIILLGI